MILLLLQLASTVPPPSAAADSTTMPVSAAVLRLPQDTTRRRAKAIDVSEWYGRRLVAHRILSYATLPVFAAQYVAGTKLYDEGNDAPSWAKPVHRYGAAALSGIFTANTVTGLWNLWDSRGVADHRALRTTHALLMLGADAAFAYTGIKLADDAENSGERRKQHRQVALVSVGVTVGSGIIMKYFNR